MEKNDASFNVNDYIVVNRKQFQDMMRQAARTIGEAEAWYDLIQLARFEATEITSRIGDLDITWGKGQVVASNRFLSKRWNWPEAWVKRYIKKLLSRKLITKNADQNICVYTIVDYDNYGLMRHCERLCECHGMGLTFRKRVTRVEPKTIKEATNVALSLEEKSSKDVSVHKEVVERFNKAVAGTRIHRVCKLTEQRRTWISARIAEHGIDAVWAVIDKVSENKFLQGGGNRGWVADFDWIFRPTNFIKILEGNYEIRKRRASGAGAVSGDFATRGAGGSTVNTIINPDGTIVDISADAGAPWPGDGRVVDREQERELERRFARERRGKDVLDIVNEKLSRCRQVFDEIQIDGESNSDI